MKNHSFSDSNMATAVKQWFCTLAILCGGLQVVMLLLTAGGVITVGGLRSTFGKSKLANINTKTFFSSGPLAKRKHTSVNTSRSIVKNAREKGPDFKVGRRTISGMKYLPYNLDNTYEGKQKIFKCPELAWTVPDGKFILEDDTKDYFVQMGKKTCAQHGTVVSDDQSVPMTCHCRQGWHGDSCSVPSSVYHSDLPNKKHIKERLKNPRRIIQAFPFNMEFSMLEARLDEVGDIVDVFMILESNYTAFGDPKDLYLLQRLREGYYSKFACKIVHVFLPYFPLKAYSNGWEIDNLSRNYIVSHGIARQLTGYREDDLFVLTDGDEVPNRDTMLFLKFNDGFPEPIRFSYQFNTLGFFWRGQPVWTAGGAVTMRMLMFVFPTKAIKVRSSSSYVKQEGARATRMYLQTFKNVSVLPWMIGTVAHPAGYHCSYCGGPEFVRNKIVSAQNGDFPRWGNYPEKRELTYIRNMIKTGQWFDGKSKLTKINFKNSSAYAPVLFLRNPEQYKHLLWNPYTDNQLKV